jgi:putative endonuclease
MTLTIGTDAIRAERCDRGKRASSTGAAAEDAVAAHYLRAGMALAARRWRSASGEIDLVLRAGDGLVFVEVKQARDFARAAERLGARQIERILSAAGRYLAEHGHDQSTEMRFDVALVDGTGRIEIRENALAA